MPRVDEEDKSEMVFTVSAEPRPRDSATQPHGIDLNASLFAQFALHTGDNILPRLDFATQPVVLTELLIPRTGDAVHHEDTFAVGVHDETKGGEDRGHHGLILPPGSKIRSCPLSKACGTIS